MQQALEKIAQLQVRADRVGIAGHRQYNNGWHTAIDLKHLLTVSEAITRAAIDRKESRGGHFRADFPGAAARPEHTTATLPLQQAGRRAAA